MKLSDQQAIMTESFRNAFREQFTPLPRPESGEHPALDLEFLERLDNEAVSPQEREELIKHLDQCGFCRQEIAFFIQKGILFADGEADTEKIADSVSKKNQKRFLSRSVLRVLSTAAALLLVVGGGILFRMGGNNSGELARQELASVLTADDRNFSGRISDYGYMLTGGTIVKDLVMPDDHTETVCAAYQKAMEADPNDTRIGLDYARYLLFVLRDPTAAREKLTELLQKDTGTDQNDIISALGIAYFEEGDDEKAQQAFRQVLENNPDSFNVRLNLAVSLSRSGLYQEATDQFERLLENPEAESLRAQIDAALNDLRSKIEAQ